MVVEKQKIFGLTIILLMAVFNANPAVADASQNKDGAPILSLRQEMEELVHNKPGVFFRSTIRDTNRTVGVCQYHTNRLVQEGRIISFETTNYKGYFPSYMRDLSKKRKTALVLLRVKNKGEILRILAEKGDTAQKDLADELGISVQNLSYHLKQLESEDLILRVKDGVSNTVKLDSELENFLIQFI